MSKVQMIRRAIRLWSGSTSKRVNRHNQRQWLKSVEFLGDRWLLARQVTRKAGQ